MIQRFFKHDLDDPGSAGSLQDLSFLLIIFFIVIAGFNVNKGFLMNLPSRDKPRVVHSNDLMKCSLSENGSMLLDGQPVTVEELAAKVAEKRATWPNMTFLLTIDGEAPYQRVIDVIYTVRRQNIDNFSFKMAEAERR